MTDSPNRPTTMLVVLLSAACVLAVLSPTGAGAQQCYPDGCTEPTNPPPSPEVGCELSVTAGDAGDTVLATVTDVDAGGVRLLFAGAEVARSTDGGAAVRLEFTVPAVDPGGHPVVAVGDTFSVECAVFAVASVSEVAGVGDEQGGGGPGEVGGVLSGGDTSTGGGSLSFTGASIALLVAVAAGLVLIGTRLVAASRRRRAAYPYP